MSLPDTQCPLKIPFLTGTPDTAICGITTTNSDGTAPSLVDADGSDVAAASFSTPVISANDGSNPALPVATYPYVTGTITAVVVGTRVLNLIADGVVDQTLTIPVTQRDPETASIPAAGVIITPGN